MKLSKKGTTPSQIGVILRDLHGVGRVTTVTGTKILRILRKQARRLPRSLLCLPLAVCRLRGMVLRVT
jgi:small subunit ribosomal protein S13e